MTNNQSKYGKLSFKNIHENFLSITDLLNE